MQITDYSGPVNAWESRNPSRVIGCDMKKQDQALALLEMDDSRLS